MKRLAAFTAAAVMAFSAAAALPFGSTGAAGTIAVSAAALVVNKTEITLYGMSSDYDDVLAIPAAYPQSFQLSVSGASSVSYRVKSGSSAKVSSTGLVELRTTTWYWKNGMGTTAKPDDLTGYTVERDITTGDTVITVTADGTSTDVTVHVVDYSDEYVNKVIDDYIAANITDDMTYLEKVKKAAAMAAGYDYSASYYTAKGMILNGGGDCWASTDLIIRVCKKLGFDAWSRNGNRDPGAGSGHRNAMVQTPDGKYYEAEAGYSGTAPRSYNVTERTTLFSYKNKSALGGVEVYQYDGKEMPETLVIPDELGGKPVVSIGESFVSMKSGIKKVVIPDSVKNISKSAFNTCYDLEEINLPLSLQTIGDFAFINSPKLKTITAPAGCAFAVKDGAVYDKDFTTLYSAPQTAAVTIPATVTTIMPYAFYYNKNIKTIIIPDGVTEIGEGTFGDCPSLEWVKLGEGVETLGNFFIANCPKLSCLVLPESVSVIENNAFYYANNAITLYCTDTEVINARLETAKITTASVNTPAALKRGDADNDGALTVVDVLLMQQSIVGWDCGINYYNADTDGDSSLSLADVMSTQQAIAGWGNFDT